MDLGNPDTEGSNALGWWGASPFYQENQPQLLGAGDSCLQDGEH